MRLWTRARRPSGSRPVPKWAAGLAAVVALGSGEAAAQLTADSTFDGNGLRVDVAERVAEGANTPITVTLKASVAAGIASTTPVTVIVEVERRISTTHEPTSHAPARCRSVTPFGTLPGY